MNCKVCPEKADVYCKCHEAYCNKHSGGHMEQSGHNAIRKITDEFILNSYKKNTFFEIKNLEQLKLKILQNSEVDIKRILDLHHLKLRNLDYKKKMLLKKLFKKEVSDIKRSVSFIGEEEKSEEKPSEDIPVFNDIQGSYRFEENKESVQKNYGLLLECHNGSIKSLAITSDKIFLISGGYDRTVRLWHIPSRTQYYMFSDHSDVVFFVAASTKSNIFMSGSADLKVLVRDIETCSVIKTLAGVHTGVISTGVFSHDNKYIITGGYDKKIVIWEFDSDKYSTLTSGYQINSLAITKDSKYVITGGWSNAIVVWDFDKKIEFKKLENHESAVQVVVLSEFGEESRLISCSKDKTIKVWKDFNEIPEFTYSEHIYGAESLCAVEGTSKIVSVGPDKSIKVWNYKDRTTTPFKDLELSKISYSNNCVSVLPGSNSAYCAGDDNIIRIVNIDNGKEEFAFYGHTEYVRDIIVTDDKKYLFSRGWDATRVWNIETKQHEGIVETEQNARAWYERYNETKSIFSRFIN